MTPPTIGELGEAASEIVWRVMSKGSDLGLGSVDRGSEDRKVHGRRPEGAGGGDDKIPGFFPGGDLRSGGDVGGGVGRVPGGGVAGVSAEGAGKRTIGLG